MYELVHTNYGICRFIDTPCRSARQYDFPPPPPPWAPPPPPPPHPPKNGRSASSGGTNSMYAVKTVFVVS